MTGNLKSAKLLRKISTQDKAWRTAGKPEGRLENALAMNLGCAYRAGLGAKARKIQNRNAAAIGTASGWER